jgi:DNA-binding CsgD family transcriptional regulator
VNWKTCKSGIKIFPKNRWKEDLLSSIEMVVRKKNSAIRFWYDTGISGNKNTSTELSGLQSEIEIVKLIADGHTTKEIALKKHISAHTVMTHRKNIFRKLDINNISELVMFAVRKGLIDNIEYYIWLFHPILSNQID